ncbi:MAG TPA: MSMEG_6728 family protein [Propionibacteriaceae bacterium]|nr:MSMEG_6728 family protein [Propionibacteriaceae bacterium]
MQTFTPYADFEQSLRTLDLRRLGKQRVEVIQIVRALTVPGYAWSSHPAVLMWKGYEEALGRYGLTSCKVWTERGFGDSCAATITADLRAAGIAEIRSYEELKTADALPPWLFDESVQRSHRSSLLRKDPEHYGPLFPPDTPRDLDYVWPVRSPAVIERELRKEENDRRRAQRTAEKLVRDLERAHKKRSEAARRGWKTRAAKAKREAERIREEAGHAPADEFEPVHQSDREDNPTM